MTDVEKLILDLFGGSGTTLIAAERTGRSARLLELDPKYVDVIIERVEFAPALESGDWIRRIRSFRPNSALMEKQQLCQISHLVDGNPAELGEQMASLARRYPHVDVWGGCCGTWDRHLDSMAAQIRHSSH